MPFVALWILPGMAFAIKDGLVKSDALVKSRKTAILSFRA